MIWTTDIDYAIEALLCAPGEANNAALSHCTDGLLRCASGPAHDALAETYRSLPAGSMRFSDRLAEAAYRLIETSPTLRREWFGRGAQ